MCTSSAQALQRQLDEAAQQVETVLRDEEKEARKKNAAAANERNRIKDAERIAKTARRSKAPKKSSPPAGGRGGHLD